MDTHSTAVPHSIDTLLAHADWVRALARHLVRDRDTAADVEQEVWRTALEHPPRHDANPRGWLASVARNAARAWGRGEGRRTRREAGAARSEALPSTAELVSEAALSRELADVVLQLDEPYRTTILLRYYRDLTVEEIAAAQGTPRETVRTRQRRGLELLRARLDATRGGRAEWLAAFAPLARVETAPVAIGGGFTGVAWFAAAAVVVFGVWLAWPERAVEPTWASLPAPAPESASSTSWPAVDAPAAPDSARAGALAAAPHAAAPVAASAPVTSPFAGRVIDVAGRPVAGLEIVAEPRFAARVEGGEVVVPRTPHTADGTPVDDARRTANEVVYWGETRVTVGADERELYAAVPEALDDAIARLGPATGLREALLGLPAPRAVATSDADGRFVLQLAPETWTFDVSDPRLVVARELGARGTDAWTLVVARAVHVAGVVVDENGAPLAQAQVQHGSSDDALRELLFARGERSGNSLGRVVLVDAAGRFDLGRVPAFPRDTIEGSVAGRVSVTVPVPDVDTRDLRLVLRPRPADAEKAVLRGLVVHADGRPAAGAQVYLGQDSTSAADDGRFALELSCCHEGMPLAATLVGFQPALVPDFGRARTNSQDDLVLRLGPAALSITGHVTGPMGKPIGGAHVQLQDGVAFSNFMCTVEDATCGRLQPGVRTGANGEFELGGLSDRAYRLVAWWDEGVVAISEPIAAGTRDVVLCFDPAQVHAEVRGRVVTRDGAPIAGVDVAARVEVFRSRGSSSWHAFGRVTTDADGAFVVRGVPRELAGLIVSGHGIETQSVALPEDPTPGVTIVANVETRIALEVADERVDGVRFLDAQGRALTVTLQLPGLSSMQERVRKKDGAFPPFDLSDAAVTAVFLAGEDEVRRAPIRIERVATQRLRL